MGRSFKINVIGKTPRNFKFQLILSALQFVAQTYLKAVSVPPYSSLQWTPGTVSMEDISPSRSLVILA